MGWGAPEKRNIILLFYLFFDQMWKIVVFIFTDICIVHILFFAKERKVLWRNKLFCEHHKQILFFIWLSLMNKVSVMPLPPFCFLFLITFLAQTNMYKSNKRYRFIKIRIWKYPFFLTLNNLSFYFISNEWIIFCTYNKVFCHTAHHANKLWI